MTSADQKPSPKEELFRDYTVTSQKAGEVSYQIYTLRRQLAELNRKMRDLNLKAAALFESEQAAEKVSQAVKDNEASK